MAQSVSLLQNQGAIAVTPSDSLPLGKLTTGVYIGTAGDLAVTMSDNTSVLLKTVPAGTFLPISITQVKATGTTASNIVAFYTL